jgi:hypothetical protein
VHRAKAEFGFGDSIDALVRAPPQSVRAVIQIARLRIDDTLTDVLHEKDALSAGRAVLCKQISG